MWKIKKKNFFLKNERLGVNYWTGFNCCGSMIDHLFTFICFTQLYVCCMSEFCAEINNNNNKVYNILLQINR